MPSKHSEIMAHMVTHRILDKAAEEALMYQAGKSKSVERVHREYGDCLATPEWPTRSAKMESLKEYARGLRGYELKLILKHYPSLFTR